jgi:parallel beta-helix repeat protein
MAAATGTYVDDTMQRTVESGWGVAPTGGEYAVLDPRESAVSGGVGTLAVTEPGSSNWAVLPGTNARDSTVRTTIALPEIPAAGGGVYTSVAVRKQTDRSAYRAKFRVLPGGEVRTSFSRVRADGTELFLGGEHSVGIALGAGQFLHVEVQVGGAGPVTLHSRVWLGGQAPDWQSSVTDVAPDAVGDGGATGLHVYLSRSTPAPAVVEFRGVQARVAGTPEPPGTAAVPGVGSADQEPPPAALPGPYAGAGVGAPLLGATAYPVPAGAVVVAPTGDDAAPGTLAAPVRTVARAIELAPSGATIVLRGGSYHESVTIWASKRLTLQPHPYEQVWFEGSSAVSGFEREGDVWVRSGWTAEFDSTPCYNAERCATPDVGFQFVGPNYPMAAHPDQVWIDGSALRQVAALSQVVTGTFYVDDAADRLYLGSDPSGREVRASDLVHAITVNGPGSVVRGVGVRRYGTPLPKIAAIRLVAEGAVLEDVLVTDNATTGIAAVRPDVTLRNVTSTRNGMLGIHAYTADRLRMLGVAATGNNVEHFNTAPVAGGFKITKSRGLEVRDGLFDANLGTGVWLDESVHGAVISGNTITRNGSHGISLELSAEAVVVDNLLAENARAGVKVNNTSGVRIWNNVISWGERAVWIVQDPRLAADPSVPGRDLRQPQPDPTMTWLVGPVTVSGNVFSHPAVGSSCVLCVEDTTGARTAEQMGVTADGNLYNRSGPTSPQDLVRWSADAYSDLASFTAATGQERAGWAVDGAPVLDEAGGLLVAVPDGVALPLPRDVAEAAGVPEGTRAVGLLP